MFGKLYYIKLNFIEHLYLFYNIINNLYINIKLLLKYLFLINKYVTRKIFKILNNFQ